MQELPFREEGLTLGFMDWQIGTAGRRSGADGKSFSPGETFVSLICLGEKGEIERIDLRPDEVKGFVLPGTVLGRWNRVMPEKGEGSEAAKAPLGNAEDLFFAMIGAGDADSEGLDGEGREARDHLLHLLGLYLERRKVLRPVGMRGEGGGQLYRHHASGAEYRVPVPAMNPAVLMTLGDALTNLIEGA